MTDAFMRNILAENFNIVAVNMSKIWENRSAHNPSSERSAMQISFLSFFSFPSPVPSPVTSHFVDSQRRSSFSKIDPRSKFRAKCTESIPTVFTPDFGYQAENIPATPIIDGPSFTVAILRASLSLVRNLVGRYRRKPSLPPSAPRSRPMPQSGQLWFRAGLIHWIDERD